MSEQESRQNIIDQEHLKLLHIAYLVSACLSAFFSLFGIMYAFMGVFFGAMIAAAPLRPGQERPPPFMGWFFGVFGLFFFVILLTMGILKFLTYRRLKERRSRVFCMVVAGISCLSIPYGTLLGVFTFVVLSRPSVMELFDR
jgi:uncharacterized protein YybS (DUF2232 family)